MSHFVGHRVVGAEGEALQTYLPTEAPGVSESDPLKMGTVMTQKKGVKWAHFERIMESLGRGSNSHQLARKDTGSHFGHRVIGPWPTTDVFCFWDPEPPVPGMSNSGVLLGFPLRTHLALPSKQAKQPAVPGTCKSWQHELWEFGLLQVSASFWECTPYSNDTLSLGYFVKNMGFDGKYLLF